MGWQRSISRHPDLSVCCSVLHCVAVCCRVLEWQRLVYALNRSVFLKTSPLFVGLFCKSDHILFCKRDLILFAEAMQRSVRLSHLVSACLDTHSWALQHAATHCSTLQHTATHTWYLHRHCNILQHTVAHCNTLQHTLGI